MKLLAALLEGALEDEELGTAACIDYRAGAGLPMLDSHVLARILIEWCFSGVSETPGRRCGGILTGARRESMVRNIADSPWTIET